VKVGVKSIAFSPDGTQYVLNCMDKTMRLYNVADHFFAMRLSGGVDLVHWKVCFFYGDDYIISCMCSFFFLLFFILCFSYL
jgi:WD40 repeat protein